MHEKPPPAVMRTCGVDVVMCHQSAVLDAVSTQLSTRDGSTLAVGSVNLDHLHHFPNGVGEASAQWLWLADGMPIVRRAAMLGAQDFPRVTGADLLPEILSVAEQRGACVGIVGGWPDMHKRLNSVLRQQFPTLDVGGMWAPSRTELDNDDLPCAIAEARVDVLVVGLGKPRQEQWIERCAALTGARVLLAFGAAADFIAGDVRRAPSWVQRAGIEWAYRLLQEPRRLARRYLVHGPPALLRLRRAELVRPTPDHPALRLLSS